jgi:Ca-activated chloride channel family protein
LLLRRGRLAEAAAAFRDPVWRGVALDRATAFNDAASVLGAACGPVAAYDAGNAFLMAGQYDDAIDSYDRALSIRPDWQHRIRTQGCASRRRCARMP